MHSLLISSPLQTEKNHLKIREGGKNKIKMEVKYFYFYSDFWKNMVGSPENQKIKKNNALNVKLNKNKS